VQVDAVVRAARATVAAAGNRAVGMVEAARQAGAAGHEALTQAMLEGLMDALARLAALESRKALTFAGAYDITKAYSPGDLTQRSGSLWLALVETTEAPGQSAHWREIAKCR